METIAYTSTPSTPAVGHLATTLWPQLTSPVIRTAIFADTTANLVSREQLDALHPFGGTGIPDDVAGAAVFLASDDAKWVTGVNLPVDGGFTAQ